MSLPLAQSEPVIPEFGEGSDCVVENRLFCVDWVEENWAGVLQPALLEHVKLTVTFSLFQPLALAAGLSDTVIVGPEGSTIVKGSLVR